MARAYLKIDVVPGSEKSVKDALNKVSGIKAADLTSGEQDIICLIEAKTYEDILKLVVEDLRGIPGIKKTITNLVLE